MASRQTTTFLIELIAGKQLDDFCPARPVRNA
jgi:hypothetical protein